MRTALFFIVFIIIGFNAKAQPEDYNAKDPNFFPIAVWLQNTRNAQSYRNVGINQYIGLWNPLDSLQLNDLHKANMKVICEQNSFALKNPNDTIITGWTQIDEPDNAQWNNSTKNYDPCLNPSIIFDRYNNMKAKDSTRPVYLNLGQGVSWIEWKGRGSKCFGDIDSYKLSKNGYIKGCDIISFDIYPVNGSDTAIKDKLWLVPKGIDSLYSWSNNTKPAWCWIETTQINEQGKRKPTPAEVKAEVWMALVHGAKGIGYFCHSWYPAFAEYALLLDTVMLNSVSNINREIASLAAVLNSPNSKDYANVNSSNPKVPIDIMTKYKETNYIFAVAMRNDTTTATFTVKSGEKVDVIGENRTINIDNGKFTDRFDGYGVHLYKITGTSIVEEEKSGKLNIYPNPSIEYLELTDELINQKEIEILSILGQSVYNGIPEKRINICFLSPGIYFLKVGSKYFKFIKI